MVTSFIQSTAVIRKQALEKGASRRHKAELKKDVHAHLTSIYSEIISVRRKTSPIFSEGMR